MAARPRRVRNGRDCVKGPSTSPRGIRRTGIVAGVNAMAYTAMLIGVVYAFGLVLYAVERVCLRWRRARDRKDRV